MPVDTGGYRVRNGPWVSLTHDQFRDVCQRLAPRCAGTRACAGSPTRAAFARGGVPTDVHRDSDEILVIAQRLWIVFFGSPELATRPTSPRSNL